MVESTALGAGYGLCCKGTCRVGSCSGGRRAAAIVEGSEADAIKVMAMTAGQVMQELRGVLANLIGEVVAVAPEEDDQVEVLRSIGNALLQNMRGAGSTPEILREKAHTVHYLCYTLVLMKGVLTERERCLHQAQALDQVSGYLAEGSTQPGDPAAEALPRATGEETKEATTQSSQMAVDRAFRMLLTYYGEDRQRMVEGEGSSVMGASQQEEWEDDADKEIDLEKSSVARSICGR